MKNNMAIDLSRSERGMRKGFMEQSVFVIMDIVLLLLTLGLLIKSMGLVFNPDKQVVMFNTDFLKSKIDQACRDGSSAMSKFAMPQPTPSKLLGASDFLTQFSIAGSKSADPHYVLYYEAFPVGEAIGWEVYHRNFDTRIILPFDYRGFNEKFTENGKPKIGNTITGDDLKGFFEEMKNDSRDIDLDAARNGIELKKTKKPILFNNIILSNDLNVLPQEPPTPPTKDISSSASGEGNAGKWINLGPINSKFEFSDYLGLTDEERTYLKYRACGENSLCLKTRDGIERIELSKACRGKDGEPLYFQMFYDARGDTDSIIYTALVGKQVTKITQDQLNRARDAQIEADKAAAFAKKAEDDLKSIKGYTPTIHEDSIARLKELAKDAPSEVKEELETALGKMDDAAGKVADAKIAGGDTLIKAAEKDLDDAARKVESSLAKFTKIPTADIAARVRVLKEVSPLQHTKAKAFAVSVEKAKNMKALRAALRALEGATEKTKAIAPKVAKFFTKGVNVVCGGVGLFTLGIGGGICKGIIYGGAAAGLGTFIAVKGLEVAKGIISFAMAFKVSDFYLASPCSIEGGSPSMTIEKKDDCSMNRSDGIPDEPPVCARLQKYPLYRYTDDFGSKKITYVGDHWTCMDSIGNNVKIQEPEGKVPCIRFTITEQKDGFCFTKNPNLVRETELFFSGTPGKIAYYGGKTISTAVNVFVDWFTPLWISMPAQATGAELPGGFGLNDLTAIAGSFGYLPVNELSSYLPESKAVALAPGELAQGVWDRTKEMLGNAVELSWTWPS